MNRNKIFLVLGAAAKFFIVPAFIFPVAAFAAENESIKITAQAASENFGRLFTTAKQRSAIDNARIHGEVITPHITGVDEGANTPAQTPQVDQPIKLLGVLLRADGKNKVWLSGASEAQQNFLNNHLITGNIKQSANVKVGVNSGAILKPGQVWSSTKGRQEAYQLPVPKPVVAEPAPKPVTEQSQPNAASSAAQTSSASSSEVHSSVQSSAK